MAAPMPARPCSGALCHGMSGCVGLRHLFHAFKGGGGKALVQAWRDLLDKDALQFSRVMCGYFPDRARHIEDAIEERGYTQELIDIAKKRRH